MAKPARMVVSTHPTAPRLSRWQQTTPKQQRSTRVHLTGGKNAAHEVLLARHRADDGVPRAPNAVLHASPAKPYDPDR